MLEWPDLIRMIQDLNHIWCQLYLYMFVYDNDGSYYIPIDKKFKQSSKLIKTGKEY
jgi:hypothetical protein